MAHTTEERAADRIVREVEQQIYSGRLPVGAALPPERDLMTQFSASRTVIREALRQLSARGLIETRPRCRPVVRQPGLDAAMDAAGGIVQQMMAQAGGLRNLFDLRILIETALVRDAAQTATPADMDRLSRALEANFMAIDDSRRFLETDVAFHAELYRIPGNPALPAIHQAFTQWLTPHWDQTPRLQQRNRGNHAAHAAIFVAIQMGDPDGAEAALRNHLNTAWMQVETSMAAQ
ncbi:MAG: FadR/GntR family transcriptional regulator [Primorskyibacter sp.]